jgi:hypothetical protein
MRYAVTPQVARAYTAAPTLLADAEMRQKTGDRSRKTE